MEWKNGILECVGHLKYFTCQSIVSLYWLATLCGTFRPARTVLKCLLKGQRALQYNTVIPSDSRQPVL